MIRFYSQILKIDVDECEKMPCGSGATCINEKGSFRCICPSDLTGASCGDPLYSNSITSKLKNIPMEQIIGVISGISVIFFVLVVFLSCRLCKRRPARPHTNNINNDTRKENAILVGVTRENGEFKRNSKMSNIEISQRNEQRPTSFTSGNETAATYACNNVFVNNLDTLRSYGSAGDELENVPPEYRKPTRINQQVNLNGHSASGEADPKQTWSDYLQLQSFTDNKINNGSFFFFCFQTTFSFKSIISSITLIFLINFETNNYNFNILNLIFTQISSEQVQSV